MNGTLPKVRAKYGLSLRVLGRLLGKDASTVLDKVHGRSEWHLSDAYAITAHIRRHFDPSATVEELFGLPALPQVGNDLVEQDSDSDRSAFPARVRRGQRRAA